MLLTKSDGIWAISNINKDELRTFKDALGLVISSNCLKAKLKVPSKTATLYHSLVSQMTTLEKPLMT